ncbi:DUF4097 family beta strand repeat-containing protein [Streptomyces caatingaensis]|uniref:DUF4097 domain-containing protein n=1 Tax=Streptomyces caatingaensis TaxID=1678637 RepID=A0A0K9XHM4_9ACTN|nr:DUF4097 family beta strand repeat-containing protein [Streptomyces caatingaensis]KNB52571.1 hypothetical protein AC230_07840 [Streptomyces caatingaensis]
MPRRQTRALALAAAVLATATLATGCSMSDTGPVKKAERTYTVDGAVKAVDAATHGGDITVLPLADGGGGDGKVRVTERYEYSKSKPSPGHRLHGGTLSIDKADCGGAHRCTVSLEIRVPRTAAVTLDSDGGSLTVRGTSGAVTAETKGGDVTIEDSAARSASAHTQGGNVVASFTAVPDTVDGRTSGGDVRIGLPKGTYAVDATTAGGHREVGVATDPGSRHKVAAHTQGGDVRVLPS